MFDKGKFIKAIVVLQATAEANNLTAVAGAKDAYSKAMEMVCNYESAKMVWILQCPIHLVVLVTIIVTELWGTKLISTFFFLPVNYFV